MVDDVVLEYLDRLAAGGCELDTLLDELKHLLCCFCFAVEFHCLHNLVI